MNIKKDDNVMVISGADKGKKGKVLVALPAENKVIVQGVAVATKHKKARGQNEPGGIVKQEIAIDASNVKLICKKCGEATRVGIKVLENGDKVRVCKKCGDTFDK